MSVTVITPERRQIALERTLPLVLLRREDEEEAHRIGDEKIGSLREIRRDFSKPEFETLIKDSKREGERPNTVEAYVRIVMSNMNVQGIGDVPVRYKNYFSTSCKESSCKFLLFCSQCDIISKPSFHSMH